MEEVPIIISTASLQEEDEGALSSADHAYSSSKQDDMDTSAPVTVTAASSGMTVTSATKTTPVNILPTTTAIPANLLGNLGNLPFKIIQMPTGQVQTTAGGTPIQFKLATTAGATSGTVVTSLQNLQFKIATGNKPATTITTPKAPITITPKSSLLRAAPSTSNITSSRTGIPQQQYIIKTNNSKRNVGVQVQLAASKYPVNSLKTQIDVAQKQLTRYIKEIHIKYQQIAKIKQLVSVMNKKLGKIGSTSKRPNKQVIMEHSKDFMSGTVLELFKMQLRMSGKSFYGRRWSREDVKFASDLFTENQDAYTYFVSIMALPAMRSLFTHDMDFMDDDVNAALGTEKGQDAGDELDEEERTAIEELISMDLDNVLTDMEKEAVESDVNISSLPELDEETAHSVRNKGLTDVLLTSKNTFVIDLTKIAEEHQQKPDSEPKKVVVYMTVPKNL